LCAPRAQIIKALGDSAEYFTADAFCTRLHFGHDSGRGRNDRNTQTAHHLRQFILAAHLYADDNSDILPSGLSENANPEDSHTPVISTPTRSNFILYAGSPRLLECPGLGPPFSQEAGWYYRSYGYVIGYNYLGGHTNTPWPRFREFVGWLSPKRASDDPSLVLVTDLNDWSPGYAKSFAPHGRSGPILREDDSSSPSANGASSKEIGAVGGNVGLLDGSVHWKQIDQMKTYRGSRLWGSGGCFAAW